VISRYEITPINLIISGVLIGLGISIIYYLNMTIMRVDGVILYNKKSFSFLILMAILFVTLAIGINFQFYKWFPPQYHRWATMGSAFILSVALLGTHYIAMITARFVPNSALANYESDMTWAFLGYIALMMLCLIFLAKKSSSIFEKRKQYFRPKYYYLIIMSILIWISISWFGSGFYYDHIKNVAYQQEAQLAQHQAQQFADSLNERLQLIKEISLISAAGEPPRQALLGHVPDESFAELNSEARRQYWTQDTTLRELNGYLASLSKTLKVDTIYLLNAAGHCIAASNANSSESFVGANFEDKDYFRQARSGQRGITHVPDRVSKSPGLFFSTPIFHKNQFIGTVVVRRKVESLRDLVQGANIFITDVNDVIILATDTYFEYRAIGHAIEAISAEKRAMIYGRSHLQTLRISSWGNERFPLAVKLGDSNDPVMLAKATLPENPTITLHILRPLRELIRLGLERSWLFAFLTVSGSLAIVAAFGLLLYWRKSRQAEINIRIAATAFESQQGILVTDVNRVILRVNKAFTDITGYTATDAVGQTPSVLFSSGRHNAAFYTEVTRTLERKGVWQGEIWSRRKNDTVFLEGLTISVVRDDAGVMTHYVDTFIDITKTKNVEDQLQRLSFYDLLTGLPNRRLLFSRLAQAVSLSKQNVRTGALLFIDLDNFKAVNDTLGYHYGDLLLEQVTKRLASCIGANDTLARFGSDEFVVILENLKSDEHEAAVQAELVGEKILKTANQPYELGSHKHRTTYGVGITLFSGALRGEDDELLKQAELAMFQAKAAGRNMLRFFSAEMQSQVMASMTLEDDLREAVLNSQFMLHYQPQVNSDDRLMGVEALIRWDHPLRGLIPPDQFIALAEDTGLIFPIGRWVLETACLQLSQWAGQEGANKLTIAVNVSARQFAHKDFVNTVLNIVKETGANPQLLKLELTESAFANDIDSIVAKMSALKTAGLRFSLDDFGTGYSSLSYLKRLPLDQLKIDQGFIKNILLDSNDAAIAKMVVVLAESLGLTVIAEGVETDAQRLFLAREGCYAYQGYLFSRPLPLDELNAYVGHSLTVL